jgi:chlorobactene glucosyltransferase
MRPLWLYLEISAVAFVVCLVLIALSNWRLLRRLDRGPFPPRFPRLSALVPARNEEAHIGDCVRSLLAQDYPDFEVVALDDHSTDRTGAILAELSASDPRLRVLRGRDLPDGWLGKHWACQQLSEAAGGELLLFTDADTRHGSRSFRHGAAALLAEDADLLTAFPHEETITWAEKLVVPVVPWAMFTFLPLALAYRTASPAFSATIGQYMLFRAPAYAQIGGHAAVRGDAVDDIALGRRIKAQGLRWRLADATHDVRCRMYQDAGQVFEGFSKNLFAGFSYRLLPFIVTWTWLLIAFVLPIGVVLARLAGAVVPALDTGIALIGVAAGLASWGLTYVRFGIPFYLIPLYPVTLMAALYIALRSVFLVVRGQSTWKGRTLVRNQMRWW